VDVAQERNSAQRWQRVQPGRHTGRQDHLSAYEGELSADASDSVTFFLRDGAGSEIDPLVQPITLRDVNAQIAITGTTQALPERIGSEAATFRCSTLA
jgi:hypothetical protein